METRIERAGEARNVQKWRIVRTVTERSLQFQAAEPEPGAVDAEEAAETAEAVPPLHHRSLTGVLVSFESSGSLFSGRFLLFDFRWGRKITHLPG